MQQSVENQTFALEHTTNLSDAQMQEYLCMLRLRLAKQLSKEKSISPEPPHGVIQDDVLLLTSGYIRNTLMDTSSIVDIMNIIQNYYGVLDQWDPNEIPKRIYLLHPSMFTGGNDDDTPSRIYGQYTVSTGECRSWKVQFMKTPFFIRYNQTMIGVGAVGGGRGGLVGPTETEKKYGMKLFQNLLTNCISDCAALTVEVERGKRFIQSGDVVSVTLDLTENAVQRLVFALNGEILDVHVGVSLDMSKEYRIFVELATTVKNDMYEVKFIA